MNDTALRTAVTVALAALATALIVVGFALVAVGQVSDLPALGRVRRRGAHRERREHGGRLAPRVGRAPPWIARHTRSGVHGRSTCRTPNGRSASTTAFCTAGVEPTVADSPIPLAPNGFIGVGVSVLCGSNQKRSAAVGIR